MLTTSLKAFEVFHRLASTCGLLDREAAALLGILPSAYTRLKVRLSSGSGGMNEATDIKVQIAISCLAASLDARILPFADDMLVDKRMRTLMKLVSTTAKHVTSKNRLPEKLTRIQLMNAAKVYAAKTK